MSFKPLLFVIWLALLVGGISGWFDHGFAHGTLVATEQGFESFELINNTTRVWSSSLSIHSRLQLHPVTETGSSSLVTTSDDDEVKWLIISPSYFDLHISDGHSIIIVKASGLQQFWVLQSPAYDSQGSWIAAQHLRIGDNLLSFLGQKPAQIIRTTQNWQSDLTFHTIVVDTLHNYFVGCQHLSILAHNGQFKQGPGNTPRTSQQRLNELKQYATTFSVQGGARQRHVTAVLDVKLTMNGISEDHLMVFGSGNWGPNVFQRDHGPNLRARYPGVQVGHHKVMGRNINMNVNMDDPRAVDLNSWRHGSLTVRSHDAEQSMIQWLEGKMSQGYEVEEGAVAISKAPCSVCQPTLNMQRFKGNSIRYHY